MWRVEAGTHTHDTRDIAVSMQLKYKEEEESEDQRVLAIRSVAALSPALLGVLEQGWTIHGIKMSV